MIFNVYRTDRNNLGDWWCAPSIYYPEIRGQIVDILNPNAVDAIINQTVILGGGGLISPTFIESIARLTLHNKVIGWGLGENWFLTKNNKYYKGPKYFHPILERFEKVGIRDINSPYTYVPCASCKHKIFDDTTSTNKNKIGFYNHFRFPIKTSINQITNVKGPLEDKINFIRDHEIIITNSYHGAYWSMLLNKKLIVVPFGSKFYGMHENVILEQPGQLKTSLDYDWPSYEGFLDHARNLNDTFYSELQDEL